MNLGLARILYPMIRSCPSHFNLSSCLLSAFLLLCLASAMPFSSCCFHMWWANGLTSQGTGDILALLGTWRGLCSFPYVPHMEDIYHLAELKPCLLVLASRMCILTLPFDCSTEKYHQLVVDMTTSNRVSFSVFPTPYRNGWVNWVGLGGLCPHLHIWLLRTTHWKRCVTLFNYGLWGVFLCTWTSFLQA